MLSVSPSPENFLWMRVENILYAPVNVWVRPHMAPFQNKLKTTGRISFHTQSTVLIGPDASHDQVLLKRRLLNSYASSDQSASSPSASRLGKFTVYVAARPLATSLCEAPAAAALSLQAETAEPFALSALAMVNADRKRTEQQHTLSKVSATAAQFCSY
jgi:hypothetical protein